MPSATPLTVLSPWEAHVRTWGGCRACKLSACRTEIVLARGDLPCDVLFVGEAPGKTEDALGEPFVGPAGQLLDRILGRALDGFPRAVRVAYSNLIACIPLDDEGEGKTEEPPPESVAACAPRLADLVRIARPRLVVRVGRHAQHHLTRGYKESVKVGFDGPWCDVAHPAWMIRKPDAFRDLEAQRAAAAIRTSLAEVLL